MAKQITKSVAKLERLLSVYDAYLRADRADDGSVEATRRLIRAQNELLDTCVDCGMSPDACEFEFAARVSTRFLCAA